MNPELDFSAILDDSEFVSAAEGMASSLDMIAEAAASASEAATGALDAMSGAAEGASAALDGVGGAADSAAGGLDGVGGAADGAAAGMDGVGGAADSAAGGLDGVGGAADSAAGGLDGVGGAADSAAAGMDTIATSSDAATASLDANTASADENTASHEANAGSAQASGASLSMLGMGAAFAAVKFVQMGISSETSFNTIQALAGASSDQMQQYESSVASMAPTLGYTTDQLAQGLYYVVSAGFQGADALNVLKVSAEAAAAGNTDMKTVADGATSALNAYGAGADQASTYVGIMTQAVTDGKQTFQDFSGAVGVGAVTAKTAGFSFEEFSAAEATMTASGLDAHRAVMNLDFTMRAIGLSVPKVAASAKKLGLAFDSNAYSGMNLIQKLQYLKQISGSNTSAFETLVGGANGLTSAEILLSGGAKMYTQDLAGMKNASTSTAAAFAAHTQTIKYHLDQLTAGFSVVADNATKMIEPALNAFLTEASNAMGFLAAHTEVLMPILTALAIILGGIVVAAVGAFVVPMLAAVAPIAAVGVAIGGFLAIAQRTPGIMLPLKNALTMVENAVKGVIAWFTPASDVFIKVTTSAKDLSDGVQRLTRPIKEVNHATGAFTDTIKTANAHISGFQKFIDGLHLPISQLGNVFKSIAAIVQQVFIPVFQSTATWFTGTLIPAIVAVVTDFNTRLGPVINQVAGIIRSFIPVAKEIGNVFTSQILPIIIIAVRIFQDVGDIIISHVLPPILSLAQWLGTTLVPIILAVVSAIASQLKPVLQSVGQFIKGLSPIIDGLVSTFKTLSPIIELVGAILGSILIVAIGFVIGVIRGLISALSGVEQMFLGAVQIISGVVSAVYDLFTGKWGKLPGDIQKIATGILNFFEGPLNTVKDFVVGFVEGVIGFFQTLFDKLVGHSIIPDLVNGIIQWISSLPGKVMAFITTLVTNFIDAITGLASSVISKVTSFVSSVLSFIGQLKDEIIARIAFMVETALNFWNKLVSSVISYVSNLVSTVVTSISNLVTNILTFFGNLASGAISAISGMVSTIISSVSSFVSSILTTIGNMATGFVNALIGLATSAATAMGQVASGILNALASLPGQMLAVGGQIMQGLLNGITSGIGNVVNGVKNAAGGIMSSITGIFGIKSPSTVMAAVGGHLMSGLALGINNGTTKAVTAMAAASQTLARTPITLNGTGALGSGANQGNAPTVINITLNGTGLQLLNATTRQQLAEQLAQEMAKAARIQRATGIAYTGSMA